MTETTYFNRIDVARRALADLLRAANGGTAPSRIRLRVSAPDETTDTAFDEDDRRDRLAVTIDSNGRLTAAIGIATHWTMLWHHDLRFARSPGQQLFLLGKTGSGPIHAWIEDDRFYLDRGSPLLSREADREAMARFNAEFAALVVEPC